MTRQTSRNKSGVGILVVEDSPTQAQQLRHFLETHGFSVGIARNGKEALAAAQKQQPALIISDIVMPEMDGYQLCKAVRADTTLKETPVVLLTSLSSPQDVIEALKSGADNFIRKPYDERHLLLRIEHILANRRLRASDKVKVGVELYLGGDKHFITAERQQILDLLISTYEQAVQLCTDLKAREEQLERAHRILRGIYTIAKGLNQAQTEQDVLDMVLSRALELPDVRAGWIFLRSEGSAFRLASSHGLPPDLHTMKAMEGDCLCCRQVLAGEMRYATNIVECERLAKAKGNTLELKSHVSLPLWNRDRVIGVMNLVGTEDVLFSEEDLRVLNGIGNQIGVALDRCRMHEHLEQLVRDRTAELTGEIEERKKVELALKESENRYRMLFDANPLPLWVFDVNTLKFLTVNEAAIRHYGYSREEFLSMTIKDIRPAEEIPRLLEDIAGTRGKEVQGRIWKHTKKDGTTIDVEISAHDFVFGEKNGRLVLAKDITEQKRAEEEKRQLELQFLQAQKLESVGSLAGGIAHDFNNILGIILGHASLLDRVKNRPELLSSSADAITRAVTRGSGLVRQLLTFSRRADTTRELIRINDIIEELVKMLRETFPKTIVIETDLEKQLPATLADPNQLYQMFLNLAINSRDAMPNGGMLTFSSGPQNREGLRRRFPDAEHDSYLCVNVSDTGTGMDEETQRRVFEPFYTTKEIGKGTGLGMSVVYGVVTGHGGMIDLQSTPGKGTTFSLYIPVKEKVESQMDDRRVETTEPPGGTETLLVVEDEEMLRELVSAVLSSKGYDILTAIDGIEAVTQYEAHRERIALVLCDMGLPRLDGVGLISVLKERNPDIKFLMVSGYLEPDKKKEIENLGVSAFVQKPYEPIDLLRKIRRVIDGTQ